MLLTLPGCGQFSHLARELEELNSDFIKYDVIIENSEKTDAVILVLLNDIDEKSIDGFNVLIGENNISIQAASSSKYLFIFDDKNNDLRFQHDEAFHIEKLSQQKSQLPIRINLKHAVSGYPINIEDKPLKNIVNIKNGLAKIGELVTLSDTHFDSEIATEGMWTPVSHLKEGHSGLFLLEPFDKNKIPVIFVHGMAGSARDFEPFIAAIDRDKYQIWLFNYPTGFPLLLVAKGLDNIINIFNYKYQFKQSHLVAHSMGGLVTKAYINICSANKQCDYISSFTSISSPFGGVASAQNGIDYAPVVMPSWRDIAPNSDFMKNLFMPEQSLPAHLLNFGYKRSGLLNQQSSDGIISLSSQLNMQAQDGAEEIRGYDEDHVSILSNKRLHTNVFDFWLRTEKLHLQ